MNIENMARSVIEARLHQPGEPVAVARGWYRGGGMASRYAIARQIQIEDERREEVRRRRKKEAADDRRRARKAEARRREDEQWHWWWQTKGRSWP